MLGFIIGTLCLIGLIRVLRHGRACAPGYGYGGWGGHGWGASRCGGEGASGWDSPRCGAGEPGCGGGERGFRRGGHHGGFGGEGAGFGGFGPKMFLRGLFERLDTTPGQEKVIFQAVDELRDAMRSAKHEVAQSRTDVAAAFGREHFDAETMGAVFSRHDDAIATVRKAFVGAMAKVHDALDEQQRRIFAEIIETRLPGMRWGFGGGPFRGQGRRDW
jgi:Spy/CpxP family protein refolding chaperone